LDLALGWGIGVIGFGFSIPTQEYVCEGLRYGTGCLLLLEQLIMGCCKLDSTLCIETSKELRTRLVAEAVYEEQADQSLTKQLVTCIMDTAYPPIRNMGKWGTVKGRRTFVSRKARKILPCLHGQIRHIIPKSLLNISCVHHGRTNASHIVSPVD
jgi:hypothetical protein